MKFSLQPLLPRSLRTRLILLVLGCMLLLQAGTLAVGSHYRKRFVDDVVMDYIVTTIRTLRAAVSEVPAEDRADFVRDASQGQWHLWSRALPAEAQLQRFHGGGLPPPPPRDAQPDAAREARMAQLREYRRMHPDGPPDDDIRRDLRGLVRQLNQRLNDGTRVALSRGPRPEVFISLAPNPTSEDAPQLREWLVIPLDRLDPPVATPMIVTWLTGFGMVMILAAWFSWHITRPLTRLAEAADKLAAGQPQRVVPSGPHETRVLGQRFNAMLDALQESESVRRTLLAGLPHDLKAPLSRMWLRIEMSDDPTLKEGLRKDLQDMQHMVDQFIGFVRGTDPAGYRYAPVPLAEWLSERVQGWQGAGTPVQLALASEQPMTIQGDAVALARLLDNLIGNALHHGAPPVEVTLAERDGMAVLGVSDHGPGIPAERRAEALRPFARLDDARTRSGNVGLGLALADAIARAHRGTLTLGRAAEGGLSVEVALPLQA
jgi:two-component system osmolarity sensor histidine kinase EnvZ